MEQYLGQIKLFCGNFAPKDWAFCNGQLLKISQNTALFSLLGNKYGGDGKTDFALPNLTGAAVAHPVSGSIGGKDGSNDKSLQPFHFPPHTHTVTANIKAKSTKDTQNNPVGHYPANSGGFIDKEYQTAGEQRMAADSLVVTSVSTEGAESTSYLSNMQPYLAVNFIICTGNGEFPPRP